MAKQNYADYKQQKQKEANVDLVGLEIGKKPPQALDVEEAVLGALLLEPNCVTDVLGILRPECFYKENHQKIYQAIANLSMRHEPVDIYTVAEELKKTSDLEAVGGPGYLSELSLKVGAAAHVDYHSKLLVQKYIQRELIGISYEIQHDAFDDGIPVDDLLDSSQQKLFSLADRNLRRETRPVQSVISQALDELAEVQQREEGISGLNSGYASLDKVTLGWQPSDLVIVAARPSMGKTAFVLTMARNMAVDYQTPIAFFSLEMSDVQLVKRLLVSESGLSSELIRGGIKFKDYEWEQLHHSIRKLVTAPLYIDDTPSLSIYEFRSKARRLVNNAGVKMIIIDYLQLMTGPPELRGMREQEVSAISRSLKAIAKELNIPIIALSQMNRSAETRGGNKRPQLSDLRESGAIEQDADLVMFIYRPEYYGILDENNNPQPGIAEIIIAKHRNGSTEDIRMRFRKEQAKFSDLNDVFEEEEGPREMTFASRMNHDEDAPF